MSHALAQPLTVVATMQMMPDAHLPEAGLQLAGFYDEDQPSEPLLAVVWRQRMMGWFPTWEMGLDIAPSLVLPEEEAPDFVHTGIVITGPAEEHVYETTISYDPVSGLVSAAVADLTAGSRIFAASARLKTHSGTLQALGGREYPERSESCFHLLAAPSPGGLCTRRRRMEPVSFGRTDSLRARSVDVGA